MALFICLAFICSGLLRNSVAEQADQGMCPYAGEGDGDDAMNDDYDGSHLHGDSKSNWQSSANERRSSHINDFEIHEKEEFDHPVLGKMKLVTIPIRNERTGEEFTTGYILVNDSETSEPSDDYLWSEESYHRSEQPADKYKASSRSGGGFKGNASGSRTHTLDSLSKLGKNSSDSSKKSNSNFYKKTENADDLSPSSEAHCSKDCCTCGDPGVTPPKEKCVRERENCCCGDSATEDKELKDMRGDADENCSWRCCCC